MTIGLTDRLRIDEENSRSVSLARSRLIALGRKEGALTEAEQAEYDRLQALVSGVPNSSSAANNTRDIFDGQGRLLDRANAFTEKQMSLAHNYRKLEGATQAQIDEQLNRRIITDGDMKVRLQDNSARNSEQAKQRDAQRAVMNFRSNGTKTI